MTSAASLALLLALWLSAPCDEQPGCVPDAKVYSEQSAVSASVVEEPVQSVGSGFKVWVRMEYADPMAAHVSPRLTSAALDPLSSQLAAALRGDADAAHELGRAWRLCRDFDPGAQVSASRLDAELRSPDARAHLRRLGLSAAEVVTLTLQHQQEQAEHCPQLMPLLKLMDEQDARDWLQLAADSGHARSLVELAALATESLQRQLATLDESDLHAEQAIEEALRARDYISDALSRGEHEALPWRARSRSGVGNSSDDRVAAMADLLAYEALRPGRGRGGPHAHTAFVRELERGMSEEEMRRASELAVRAGLDVNAPGDGDDP